MDKASTPKFGTFKPKPAAGKDSGDQLLNRSKPESTSRTVNINSKHSDIHDSRYNQRTDPYRPGSDYHRHARQKGAKSSVPASAIPSMEYDQSDLFIVDQRGDAKNVEFGSLHRYAVPSYHRNGLGSVIGIASSSKINRFLSSERDIVLNSDGRDGRSRSPRPLTSKWGKPPQSRLRFIKRPSEVTTNDAGRDYIELRPPTKRARLSESPGRDVPTIDYRSIEGKAKPISQAIDEDVALESDAEDDGSSVSLDSKARTVATLLYENAKANSTDIDRWLALVEHQYELVRPGHKDALSPSERNCLADLRLTVLREAATHIGRGSVGRERLLDKMLEEGSRIWSNDRLSAKWQDALIECPGSISLWINYLNFIQDSHAGFHVETCKNAYISCLKILSDAVKEKVKEAKAINRIRVYILVRFTSFLSDSGYRELSLAVWQALLEYHFALPIELSCASLEDQMASLKGFWEDEAPRLGEIGAEGWAAYLQAGSTAKRTSQRAILASNAPDQPLINFAQVESTLSDHFVLPASADDDDSVEDPYRCVMFADVEQVIEHSCKGLLKFDLLDGFLHYFGLPLMLARAWEYSNIALLDDPHLLRHDERFATDLISGSSSYNGFITESRHETFETLFTTAVKVGFSEANLNHESGLVKFLDRIFDFICRAIPSNEEFAIYYVAFKLNLIPAEASQCAKRLLRRRPSSLKLYNAYGLIVSTLASLEEAAQIWHTAIMMSPRLPKNEQNDVVYLWQSRLLRQVTHHQDKTAMSDLLTFPQSSNEHQESLDLTGQDWQIRRLKVTKLFEERFDHMLLAGHSVAAAAYANLHSWFSYLSTANNLDQALQVYRRYVARMKLHDDLLAMELLYQSEAELLKLHLERRRPYRPATLRDENAGALTLFPNNSTLLKLGGLVRGQERLRSLFEEHKISMSPRTVVQWAVKLSEEMHRAGDEFWGSTLNTIRAMFWQALRDPDTKVAHSYCLWRQWLDFERSVHWRKGGSFREGKQVFLDGLRYLPWHKGWILHGLKVIPEGAMSADETRQVIETMLERGLRIQTDVENFI